MSIPYVAFSAGIFLMVIAIFGGGIEIKEVKIPSLGTVPRVLSFVLGASLLGICLFKPEILPQDFPRHKTESSPIASTAPDSQLAPIPQLSSRSASNDPSPILPWLIKLGSFDNIDNAKAKLKLAKKNGFKNAHLYKKAKQYIPALLYSNKSDALNMIQDAKVISLDAYILSLEAWCPKGTGAEIDPIDCSD